MKQERHTGHSDPLTYPKRLKINSDDLNHIDFFRQYDDVDIQFDRTSDGRKYVVTSPLYVATDLEFEREFLLDEIINFERNV